MKFPTKKRSQQILVFFTIAVSFIIFIKYYLSLGLIQGSGSGIAYFGIMLYYLIITVPISIIVKNLKVFKKLSQGNDAKLDIIAILVSTAFYLILPFIIFFILKIYEN